MPDNRNKMQGQQGDIDKRQKGGAHESPGRNPQGDQSASQQGVQTLSWCCLHQGSRLIFRKEDHRELFCYLECARQSAATTALWIVRSSAFRRFRYQAKDAAYRRNAEPGRFPDACFRNREPLRYLILLVLPPPLIDRLILRATSSACAKTRKKFSPRIFRMSGSL